MAVRAQRFTARRQSSGSAARDSRHKSIARIWARETGPIPLGGGTPENGRLTKKSRSLSGVPLPGRCGRREVEVIHGASRHATSYQGLWAAQCSTHPANPGSAVVKPNSAPKGTAPSPQNDRAVIEDLVKGRVDLLLRPRVVVSLPQPRLGQGKGLSQHALRTGVSPVVWQVGQRYEPVVRRPRRGSVADLRDKAPIGLGEHDAVLGLEGMHRVPTQRRFARVGIEDRAKSVEVSGLSVIGIHTPMNITTR